MHPDSGTLFVGVHGMLQPASWLQPEPSEEDAFSLIYKRAAALGLSDLGPQYPPCIQWYQDEAGGDWTADGTVRELAWLQAGLPAEVRRIPLVATITVLADAVRRVGQADFTGIHAVVPMNLAGDARGPLADAADWFALADPHTDVELAITISADSAGDLAVQAMAVTAAAAERAHGQLAITPTTTTADSPPPGLATPIAAQYFVPSDSNCELTFACHAREWSPAVAAWVAEIFTDALCETGSIQGPAFITVSLAHVP